MPMNSLRNSNQTAAPPAAAIAVVPAASPGGLPRVSVDQLMAFPDAEKKAQWISALVEAEVARQTYAQDRALARDFAIERTIRGSQGRDGRTGDRHRDGEDPTRPRLGVQCCGRDAVSLLLQREARGRKRDCRRQAAAGRLSVADAEWLEDEVQHKGKPWRKCIGCTLWLKRWNGTLYTPLLDRNGKPVSVSFSEGDADHAMIWEKGKQIPLSQKWNFVSWARDMYYWRSIARVKKYHAPHVLRGAVSKEEALDIIPAGSPPDMLPRELQAPRAGAGAAAADIQMPDPPPPRRRQKPSCATK